MRNIRLAVERFIKLNDRFAAAPVCYRSDYGGEKLLQRENVMDTVVKHAVTAASHVKNGSHLEDSCHYTTPQFPPSYTPTVTSYQTLTICRGNHSLYHRNDNTSDALLQFVRRYSKIEYNLISILTLHTLNATLI